MANYTPKPRVARIGTDPRVLSPVVRGGEERDIMRI